MRSLSASARSSGLMYSTPAPSPRTYPLARASKAKHCPVGDNIEALLKPIVASGIMSALTPPARALSQQPDQMLWHAFQIATSAEEQAVSTERLGPRRSNKYEIRFDAILKVQ